MYSLLRHITGRPERLARVRRWGRLLPYRVVTALCWLGAGLAVLAAPGLRRRLLDNLRQNLPGQGRLRRLACCVAYLANLLILLYEVMVDVQRLPAHGERRFLVEGLHQLEAARRDGRGAILFAPHMGNFFYAYWYLCQRYPCLTVGTAGSPELRPLYQAFFDLGCPGLDYDRTAPRELVGALRDHLAANGVVLLLGDFWRPGFPAATFLDRSSRSPQGAARLALDGDVPIIPLYVTRRGWRQRLAFGPPRRLRTDFARHERAAATNALNAWMSAAIRRHPSQWLYWLNVAERWESPPEARAERTA
ncbi:MAG TPA: lysophospholipid acyltransferase family protein [Herpetosiphonaceae bacterium]|nr:lysophospholipid acyltransferase family protein [Herpetosiphonaceae bacterium]